MEGAEVAGEVEGIGTHTQDEECHGGVCVAPHKGHPYHAGGRDVECCGECRWLVAVISRLKLSNCTSDKIHVPSMNNITKRASFGYGLRCEF